MTEEWCNDKYRDSKKYWRKIKPHKSNEIIEIPLQQFQKYYTELFAVDINPCDNELGTYSKNVEMLDKEFEVHELEGAINHQKNGKAAGSDDIKGEFLRYGRDNLKYIFTDLCNTLYNEGFYPDEWATGIIIPIFKKGDRSLPSNYRGITLTSCMSKVFTYILNQRLCRWFEQSDILSQSQFAYRQGYSTTDAVFVLNSVLSLNLHRTVYCAFIDFTKAFDCIDRQILYRKLMNSGVSSKMLHILVNMYSKIKSKVRTTEGTTNSFEISTGLMQGECLSPSLFSFYINDMDEVMNDTDSMGILVGATRITVLKYADDVVLLSSSVSGLQNGLNNLYDYCVQNKLNVNITKSKLMCFSRRVNKNLPEVHFNDHILEWVDSFKYLGVTFTRTCSFIRTQEMLCEQARRAQTVLDLHILRHPTLSVQHILELFDTLIKPILLFGCEVWGVG